MANVIEATCLLKMVWIDETGACKYKEDRE